MKKRIGTVRALVASGLLVAAAAIPVAATPIAIPTAASAAPLRTEDAAACAVQSAELRWGVKESFRSYISGSIANGEWTVSEDMRYETPDFIWDRATGSFSGSLEEGRIAFTGAVHFTGHDGAMQLDLADPVIEFAGPETAYLLLTMGATDAANAGGEAPASEVRAAKIDLAGALDARGGELGITAAPARLTAEGAAAFNGEYGSYVSGEELDPISLTASGSGCELAEASAEPADPGTGAGSDGAKVDGAQDAESAAAPAIPWAPVVVAGVAILVIGVTVGMLITGRGKKTGSEDPAS